MKEATLTKTFAEGTLGRCNRCGHIGPLDRQQEGVRENERCYRLQGMAQVGCGHPDSHWVMTADNLASDPS